MAKNLDVVTIGSIIKETIVYPDKQIGPVIGSPAAYSSCLLYTSRWRIQRGKYGDGAGDRSGR